MKDYILIAALWFFGLLLSAIVSLALLAGVVYVIASVIHGVWS